MSSTGSIPGVPTAVAGSMVPLTGEASTRTAGIIVAAGRGTRYGATDKVLLPLDGRPILAWVLDAFAASSISELVIVVGSHTEAAVTSLIRASDPVIPVRVVIGGERRQDSVACGMAAVSKAVDVVLVHDAARPMVSATLIDRTIEHAWETGAAIAASPVTDTLKRVRADLTIEATVPRDGLWAAQTPQAFRRDLLAEAFLLPLFRDRVFTDEAALVEAIGHAVAIVPNHEPNPKVTYPGDLAVIEALLSSRSSERELAR